MLVWMVINSLRCGGAEQFCQTLAGALAARGHELAVVATIRLGRPPQTVPSDLPVRVLDLPARSHWRQLRRLYQLFRQERPDAVLGLLDSGCRVGVVAARLAGVPAVVSCYQNSYPESRRAAAWFERLAFCCAHHGVACSPAVRDFLQHVWRLPRSRLSVIHNAIEVAAIPCREPQRRACVRAALGLSPAERAVICVASLTRQKGHAVLLPAIAAVQRQRPEVRWFLAGDGALREELVARAAQLGVQEVVTFLGERDDIVDLLQGMDLFVLPSLCEGLGLAAVEAMASGLPVVGSAVDGLREVVAPGRTGWLVPPAQPAVLADALLAALSDPPRGVAMGLAGRARAAAHFDIGPAAARYAALLERLVGR